MGSAIINTGLQQTTSYKVVLPFYAYATLSFVVATILLATATGSIQGHYFNPHVLSIVHTLALGWGTMIILGASHQLLPVIIEGKLSSTRLAMTTFVFMAIGIPLLIHSFYTNHFGTRLHIGGALINIGVICYVANVFLSIRGSEKKDVHAWYMAGASIWLLMTTIVGWLLALNFNYQFLPANSLQYLSIHAHLGIIGWFLLLVIGVGSRLIPMFLISKYTNNFKLWVIFVLIHLSLFSFLIIKSFNATSLLYYIPLFFILFAVILFGNYCKMAHAVRIRKSVDEQMKVSLISVMQLVLPIVVLLITIGFMPSHLEIRMIYLYGFSIFFGWITAIIFGMTFKTLPFIVWNKVYHTRTLGKTPTPKDLFNEKIFSAMSITYLVGFVGCIFGILFMQQIILQLAALIFVISALLYAINVGIVFFHQPKIKQS